MNYHYRALSDMTRYNLSTAEEEDGPATVAAEASTGSFKITTTGGGGSGGEGRSSRASSAGPVGGAGRSSVLSPASAASSRGSPTRNVLSPLTPMSRSGRSESGILGASAVSGKSDSDGASSAGGRTPTSKGKKPPTWEELRDIPDSKYTKKPRPKTPVVEEPAPYKPPVWLEEL